MKIRHLMCQYYNADGFTHSFIILYVQYIYILSRYGERLNRKYIHPLPTAFPRY